jgi:hypothetical protein
LKLRSLLNPCRTSVKIRWKGSQDDRATLLIDLQGAALTLRGLASLVNAQQFDAKGLARAQATRFAVREAVNRVSTRAFELGSSPSSE